LPLDLPDRSQIVTVSFAVVAFSIFVQGLTITPLLRQLGEISPIVQPQNIMSTEVDSV
jgi:CPA1 family monovalent cation:H+ antiporter